MSSHSTKKFPTVPNVSSKDPNVDPYLAILAAEQRAREKLVAIAEIKILEKRVQECFKKEGVNHYVNCQKFTREYYKRIARPDFNHTPVEMDDVHNPSP